MLNNELSNLIFYKNYSKIVPGTNKKETFELMIDRIIQMHLDHLSTFKPEALINPIFKDYFEKTSKLMHDGMVFGSQRANQFGGQPILNKNMRLYNCSTTYVDRPRVFAEIMHTLLCGAGVGVSVQRRHVDKLPSLKLPTEKTALYTIGDSIEHWSDAIDSLIMSYVNGTPIIKFDYSLIRPKGAYISGGFLAPGPEKLQDTLEKIRKVLNRIVETDGKIKSINAFDIICYIADAVISGGVRRSALITLFDNDDDDMMKAKTGNWFYENPQRARKFIARIYSNIY